ALNPRLESRPRNAPGRNFSGGRPVCPLQGMRENNRKDSKRGWAGGCVSGEAPRRRMPISEAPANVNEPKGPTETSQDAAGSDGITPVPDSTSAEPASSPAGRTSRWVDYDTHELLEMISELEDERRWSRLREGIWLAILIHFILLSVITWIPRYVLKQPPVINPFD